MHRLSTVFVALLALTPAIAVAQPDGSAAVAALEVELRLESIARVVESIATRLERTDPAKADQVRSRANASEAFAKRNLSTDAESMLKDLFKADLAAGRLKAVDLKFDLMLHRAYDSGYRMRDISARMPSETTGFNPPRSRGYPAEVAAIENNVPHSMHDLHDYMADRFTLAALNKIVTDGHVVEIHIGGELEALSDLRNRGWKVLGEVKAINGNYERLFMAEGPGGEIRYVISGDITGMDRVRHLSALLRFAGPNGEGVPSNKVEIVGDVKTVAENDYRAMRTGLERMGLPGDRAIIGFRGALKTELTERALARRGAEHLHDVLGSDPHKGLVDRLKAAAASATGARRNQLRELAGTIEADTKLAEGLKVRAANVFARVAVLKKLQAAEKALVELAAKHPTVEVFGELVADGKLRLPGGASSKTYGVARSVEYGPLRAEELRVKTSGGVEGLRLLNNYYGDAMAPVVRALADAGYKRVAYFGTAGGTADGVRVGDVHVPKSVYDFRGELASEGISNSFLEFFGDRGSSPLGDRLRLNTELGNVFSPAEETMSWLEDVRSRGLHSIEVENSYITREIARYNRGRPAAERVSLHTSVIISDVPGSEVTLGNNNGATTHTFEKMVDHYLEALDIKDLELVEKTEAKRPTSPLARDDHRRAALEVAEKLIPRARNKSNLLRDRLAGILGNLDPAKLAEINAANASRLKLADVTGLSEADAATLKAEVDGAYTDADVLASLSKGNAVVSRLAAELAAKHPNANYEIRVGGGIERGSFSPIEGLVVDVRGSAEIKNDARTLLESIRAEIGGPEVRLGEAGSESIRLGKGEVFASKPRPLVREFHDRIMSELGANHRGTRVEYSGAEHDAAIDPASLYSRYEINSIGPSAADSELRRFERLAERHGGRVEYVPSSDPRLLGGQGRTVLAADGSTLVLLPSDKPVKRFALLDELTHLNQIDRMARELGRGAVADLFARAAEGDPAAVARMLEWELKAKRNVRLTLAQDDPNRALLDREIERIKRALDPYAEVRLPSGRINWEKVRGFAKTHAQGSASFLLGLFLKDLARVIETGDREVISAFFDGLATTEFWKHYGLFVVGAEAGTLIYTKYLQRFVKPGFVNTVLKSNVALATGMALPELIRGHFDGRTYAINLAGLMLSSTAVRAGLTAIKWVAPLGRLSRYTSMSRFLSLSRGVPGWIYAGVETAVVLYFGESISASIGGWLEERRMRGEVAAGAEGLLAAARTATDAAGLDAALEATGVAYTKWRDRSFAPAMAASARLNDDLARAGRDATIMGTGVSRFNDVADRYPHLRGSIERLRGSSDSEVEKTIDDAVARFERTRDEAMRTAYHENLRSGAYDPLRGARKVSENRPQAYEDEALLYEAAADVAGTAAVADALREAARITRLIAVRERELLDPSQAGRSSVGATTVLDGLNR